MRRISSLVWKDMRKIQKIGNRKKRTIRTIRTPRTDALKKRTYAPQVRLLLRHSAGAFAQFQPLLDEDVRQRISHRPQDD